MADFFAMNGYGYYVWAAYGVTLCILLAVFLASKDFTKKTEVQLMNLRDEDHSSKELDGNETKT